MLVEHRLEGGSLQDTVGPGVEFFAGALGQTLQSGLRQRAEAACQQAT